MARWQEFCRTEARQSGSGMSSCEECLCWRSHSQALQQSRRSEERRMRMSRLIRAFHNDESGQDLIEYVLVAAGIAIGSIALMQDIAIQVNTVITALDTAVQKIN